MGQVYVWMRGEGAGEGAFLGRGAVPAQVIKGVVAAEVEAGGQLSEALLRNLTIHA